MPVRMASMVLLDWIEWEGPIVTEQEQAKRVGVFPPDEASLEETVRNSRFGVMTNWQGRLSESEIRSVSVYVHSLGGGE